MFPLSLKVTLTVLIAVLATMGLASTGIFQQSPWYSLLWLVLVTTVSSRYAKYLSGAARALLRGILEITAKGTLKTRIAPRGRDEIGAIAEAFNELTASLQAHKEKLAARLAELEFLHEATRSLTQAGSLQELLPRLLEKSLQAVGRRCGAIYLARGSELFLAHQRGLDEVAASGAVHRLALERIEPLPELSPNFPLPLTRAARECLDKAFGKWAMVPLQAGCELVGSIVIAEDVSSEGPVSGDVRFIETIAGEFSTLVHNSLLAEKVKAQEKELRRLALDAITSQDAERARLSRELHDSVGQALGVVKFNLELLQNRLASQNGVSSREIYQWLGNSVEMVREAMVELRRIVDELRPSVVEEMGLADAIRWFSHCLRERTGIAVEALVDIDGNHLDPAVETAIYRIVQEACTNAIKHGQASSIYITLRGTQGSVLELGQDSMLELRVEDNGRGFLVDELGAGNQERVGSGLRGIRERVLLLRGEVNLVSAPGRGTCLEVRLPRQPRFILGFEEGGKGDAAAYAGIYR